MDPPSTKAPPERRQHGISLIECLACIAILGTAVVSGLSLASVQSQVVTSDELTVLANRYLKREFEHCQGTHYAAIDTTAATTVDEDSRFAISYTVTERSSMYKEVTISIAWLSESGVARTESLTTLRCKNTLD
ncbi:MAG: hypothetical protein AAF581_05280 [Planctomycetota bacterium]